ncbi:MAG: aromatic ring-hydroxylating dioxygenase subunit alpha [Chromatiales bacterium]|jgi:choline monooxygenase|nr:aromatic ring-hydroxylating dioxygenase subunit alpha [Chromatiales bacterium]
MPLQINELLNEATIRALRDPVLDAARGLPASVYTSGEFFAREQDTLFPSTWMGIAFDTDVPLVGDGLPLEICGLPVILTRDDTGTVRVLHNVCRHRATIVLDAPCHGAKTFNCPYHGWVYGLDGALKATPFWDGTPDSHRMPVDADRNGLVPVRTGVWNHVVFVNLDGLAPPLNEYLAPMDAELAHLDIPDLDLAHRRDWSFKANWKLVMENWEVYHHVWVHEGVFDRMSDEVNIKTGVPYTEMAADGNSLFLRYTPDRPGNRANNGLPPVPRRFEPTRAHSVANAVLPNTTVTISDTSYAPAIYVPIAPGVTEARMAWYLAPEAATGPDYEMARERVLDRWLGATRRFEDRRGIRPQDHRCMELQQMARVSPVADDVKFSTTWEANVRYFQDWVVRQLGL